MAKPPAALTKTDTTDLVFSPDSQSLVFGSSATDLTANLPDNSTNPAATLGAFSPQNLFLRNLAAGTTTLLSVTTAGLLPVHGDSSGVVFSPDGKSVAFTSDVTNLTANGTDFTAPASVNSLLTNPDSRGDQHLHPKPHHGHDHARHRHTERSAVLRHCCRAGLQSRRQHARLHQQRHRSHQQPTRPHTPARRRGILAENGFAAPIGNVFLRNLAAGKTTLVIATPSGKLSSGAVNEQTPLGPLVFSPERPLPGLHQRRHAT